MKPYPVNFKYSTHFDLMPAWVPPVLQNWLEEGWTCDITVKRVNGCYGRKTARVIIEASSTEELAAKRRAFNAMIEEQGYGPDVIKK